MIFYVLFFFYSCSFERDSTNWSIDNFACGTFDVKPVLLSP
uniref:Uncharacterized protein n=1 Tax=Rhizophora mucronata TaxID=61149 RepID=A0A2P2QZF9_RHIMU